MVVLLPSCCRAAAGSFLERGNVSLYWNSLLYTLKFGNRRHRLTPEEVFLFSFFFFFCRLSSSVWRYNLNGGRGEWRVGRIQSTTTDKRDNRGCDRTTHRYRAVSVVKDVFLASL